MLRHAWLTGHNWGYVSLCIETIPVHALNTCCRLMHTYYMYCKLYFATQNTLYYNCIFFKNCRSSTPWCSPSTWPASPWRSSCPPCQSGLLPSTQCSSSCCCRPSCSLCSTSTITPGIYSTVIVFFEKSSDFFSFYLAWEFNVN